MRLVMDPDTLPKDCIGSREDVDAGTSGLVAEGSFAWAVHILEENPEVWIRRREWSPEQVSLGLVWYDGWNLTRDLAWLDITANDWYITEDADPCWAD